MYEFGIKKRGYGWNVHLLVISNYRNLNECRIRKPIEELDGLSS